MPCLSGAQADAHDDQEEPKADCPGGDRSHRGETGRDSLVTDRAQPLVQAETTQAPSPSPSRIPGAGEIARPGRRPPERWSTPPRALRWGTAWPSGPGCDP